MTRTWRLSGPVVILLAVIAVLILADIGIVALRLASGHPTGLAPSARSGPTAAGPTAAGHPCNHGAYVSAAAHAHKGGGYVSSVAKGKLGKNGNCAAPLPAAPAASGGDD